MQKVIVRREVEACPEELSDLHPILQRIYAARHVTSKKELIRELKGLLPFDALSNIQLACERLETAFREQQTIIIVGDFDADGATSTATAVTALRELGAKNVNYLVPNRFTYGYGLSPGIVDAASELNPQLIITVDNGVASHAGVERANELGIDVIITDHHLPGEVLPPAYAIVNPNLKGDTFPSKNLAGVGVIFYVMLALRSHLRDSGWFEQQGIECPNMATLLDLVALGTVADVVALDSNNRVIVHQGLRRIRAGKMRPGIRALIEVAGRDYRSLQAADLGYAVAPRLNAAGRIDDMALGIECLMETDYAQAVQKAERLNELNYERRAIESDMRREAFDIVDQLHLSNGMPMGLCLYDSNWHQGVVGLVASRVKEKFHRPVIAFADVDETTIKGSARSIKGLHIRDALDAIATEHPEVLSKFGGHAMAAGLTINKSDYDTFTKLFDEVVRERLSDDDLCYQIESDGDLSREHFTLDLAETLRQAGPWGQGFPEPMFDGEFRLLDQQIVGEKHLKAVLQVPGTDCYIDGIAFNVDTDQWPNRRVDTARLAYRLSVNEYKGRKKLQLMIEEIQVDQVG